MDAAGLTILLNAGLVLGIGPESQNRAGLESLTESPCRASP